MRNNTLDLDPLYETTENGEPVTIIRRGTRMRKRAKVGRNQECACGSGRKYKHCCLGCESINDLYKVVN